MELQMDELLAFYPPRRDPEIQTLISAKKEFRELASDPFEVLKRIRGDYFKHQKLIEKFIEHYNTLILYHETGTGKSCAITAASEVLKRHHFDNLSSDPHLSYIERAYIIVKNDTLLDRMKDEIICRCTDGIYDTPEAGDSKQKVHKNLNQWYELVERERFARRLAKMSNEEIFETFSNTIVFVDEAHLLRFRKTRATEIEAEIESFEETQEESLKKLRLSGFKRDDLIEIAKIYDLDLKGESKKTILNILKSHDPLKLTDIKKIIESKEYEYQEVKKKKASEIVKEDIYVQFQKLFSF
jgi:hypothetical protein